MSDRIPKSVQALISALEHACFEYYKRDGLITKIHDIRSELYKAIERTSFGSGKMALAETDKRDLRLVIEFVMNCRERSPRSTEVNCIAPIAERLKESLKL